jgi:hypothetical protein
VRGTAITGRHPKPFTITDISLDRHVVETFGTAV